MKTLKGLLVAGLLIFMASPAALHAGVGFDREWDRPYDRDRYEYPERIDYKNNYNSERYHHDPRERRYGDIDFRNRFGDRHLAPFRYEEPDLAPFRYEEPDLGHWRYREPYLEPWRCGMWTRSAYCRYGY